MTIINILHLLGKSHQISTNNGWSAKDLAALTAIPVMHILWLDDSEINNNQAS
jgi:hypothetical protein